MNLKKKIGKVLTSKFVGTGPSSYEKRIYRAAVLQRLRNTAIHTVRVELMSVACAVVHSIEGGAGFFLLGRHSLYTALFTGDCWTAAMSALQTDLTGDLKLYQKLSVDSICTKGDFFYKSNVMYSIYYNYEYSI